MTGATLLALSTGLAMDATAVSAARGFATDTVRPGHVVRVAVCFGGFQALMPIVGWLLGDALGSVVTSWSHWVAFALLSALGGKMLWDAREPEPAREAERTADLYRTRVLLVLGVATSIDALAAGITLPLLGAPMLASVATIGVVTAILSALGLLVGHHFRTALGRRLDVVGGLVLIAIGAKILVERL